jgi:uncharacterized coiled-coil protein SlyX
MDGLQEQIVNLNGKVEQLHEIVQQMSQQLSTLAHERPAVKPTREPIAELEAMLIADPVENNAYASLMDHKDILMDGRHRSRETETVISADTQIRRLTAQLTAAYNRIAALEEQLLSYRIHSYNTFAKLEGSI